MTLFTGATKVPVRWVNRGVSRIFERGGGPISLGSLKKGHQILKGGGSNGLKGGSSTFVSLGRQILNI